jgi:hypothetical protein
MAIKPSLVFYSWQSDLPNSTNRGFILQALENAAKTLKNDDSLQVEPVIDRDTDGVPGSPNISETIFGKIDQAQVFVCDISIINQNVYDHEPNARLTPNPNVLLELGYALKTLGDRQIILVLNDAYGIPELLPFDLRMRRVIRYHMAKEDQERASERRRLEGILVDALRASLSVTDIPLPGEVIQPLSRAKLAQTAIEEDRPNQVGIVRKYMAELAKDITAITPQLVPNEPDRWDEQLLEAIDKSTEMVLDFSHLTETIAQTQRDDVAETMYKGFRSILDLYTFPADFRGAPQQYAHDLAKFLGHELFVTFFAFLIQEERWRLIANLLHEELHARIKDFGLQGLVPFHHISLQEIGLLEYRKKRLKLDRMSLRGDLLTERHTTGALQDIMPVERFAEADFFLFLRTQLQPEVVPDFPMWAPWSMLAMRYPPSYLRQAVQTKYATQLLEPLGVHDIPSLRRRLQDRAGKIVGWWGQGFWHYPLSGFDFNTLASR